MNVDVPLEPSDLAVAINQAHGQAIESKHVIGLVADQIRNPLAQLAGQSQTVINRTGRTAMERIGKTVGRAQGTVDGIVQDLSAQLHSTIESAVVPLIELGVELPTAEQIAAIKAQQITPLAPTIPPPPHIGGTCLVHLLPDSQKVIYTDLCQFGGQALCMPTDACPSGSLIHRFPRWWQAELACRLMNECHQTKDWIIRYSIVIERVRISDGSQSFLKPLCPQAPIMIEQWAAQNLGLSFRAS